VPGKAHNLAARREPVPRRRSCPIQQTPSAGRHAFNLPLVMPQMAPTTSSLVWCASRTSGASPVSRALPTVYAGQRFHNARVAERQTRRT
jgi:hypothetical protein